MSIPQSRKAEEFDFTKLFGVIPALLIMLGVTRLGFYYSEFNINILPFLEFSEILTSFLDFTLVIIATVSSFLFIPMLMSPKRMSVRNKVLQVLRPILFFMPMFMLFYIMVNRFTAGAIGYVGSAGGLITALWVVFFGFQDKNSAYSRKDTFLFVGISFSLLIVCMYFVSKIQKTNVKERAQYFGVQVIFNDNTNFSSDSATYYIGNTSDFLFIFDEKQDRTTVVKMNDVKSIVFP